MFSIVIMTFIFICTKTAQQNGLSVSLYGAVPCNIYHDWANRSPIRIQHGITGKTEAPVDCLFWILAAQQQQLSAITHSASVVWPCSLPALQETHWIAPALPFLFPMPVYIHTLAYWLSIESDDTLTHMPLFEGISNNTTSSTHVTITDIIWTPKPLLLPFILL